jgi:hypothetical protein
MRQEGALSSCAVQSSYTNHSIKETTSLNTSLCIGSAMSDLSEKREGLEAGMDMLEMDIAEASYNPIYERQYQMWNTNHTRTYTLSLIKNGNPKRTSDWKCSCPAGIFRGYCKHTDKIVDYVYAGKLKIK